MMSDRTRQTGIAAAVYNRMSTNGGWVTSYSEIFNDLLPEVTREQIGASMVYMRQSEMVERRNCAVKQGKCRYEYKVVLPDTTYAEISAAVGNELIFDKEVKVREHKPAQEPLVEETSSPMSDIDRVLAELIEKRKEIDESIKALEKTKELLG